MKFTVLAGPSGGLFLKHDTVRAAQSMEDWDVDVFTDAVEDAVLSTGIAVDLYDTGQPIAEVKTSQSGEMEVELV